MTNTHIVLLPVYRGLLHSVIEKGIQWSDIEHLILYGLTTEDFTITEYQSYSGLPKTLISETISRLMRAGWVEIQETKERISFRASLRGLAVVDRESLPAVVNEVQRNIHYIIDKLSFSVFPMGKITLLSQSKANRLVANMGESPPYILTPNYTDQELPGIFEVTETILTNPDEKFLRHNSQKSWIDRNCFVKLFVTESQIEGLPSSIAAPLEQLIMDDVKQRSTPRSLGKKDNELWRPRRLKWKSRKLKIDQEDVVIGGPSHESLLERIFEESRRRIIIHSTFVDVEKFRGKVELFKAAANRGVLVSLLWAMPQGDNSAGKKLRKCREILNENGLGQSVKLHSAPTNSHAKLIVADDGGEGYFSIIGSCNWLYSGFEPLEISVKLCNPHIVADCLSVVERLIRRPRNREELLREQIVALEHRLRSTPDISDGDSFAELVSSSGHEDYVMQARDTAKDYIFVASDRLGGAAETQILVPTDSVAQSKPVEVTVSYNRRSGVAKEKEALPALKEKYQNTVNIIRKKGAHAKVLCWDSDNVVITSLNWLSKDANDPNWLGEIGVYLKSPGIADYIRDNYLES